MSRLSQNSSYRRTSDARMSSSGFHPHVESLEDRLVLSHGASLIGEPLDVHNHDHSSESQVVLPDRHHLFRFNDYLTEASTENPQQIAMGFLRDNAAELGLTSQDFDHLAVTNAFVDDATGTSHFYFRQVFRGLQVRNSDLNVNVNRDGRVINVGGGFLPGLSALPGTPQAPSITAAHAIEMAAEHLGLTLTDEPEVLEDMGGGAQEQMLRAEQFSLEDIHARLEYAPIAGGYVSLVWQLRALTPDGEHAYDFSVDALTGSIVAQIDMRIDFGSYQVFALPKDSPDDGPRTIEVNPDAVPGAPYPGAWHDTDGDQIDDSTLTTGNNVVAQQDGTNARMADGGATRNFSFPLNLALDPLADNDQIDSAITNAFYWANIVHDITYVYGFDEVSGNFQLSNYGNGGLEGDPITLFALDPNAPNNAFYVPTPDGTPSQISMGIFDQSVPSRASAFANDVIVHEYFHGVSIRLTGGGANANSLNATQSRGMGEGWSDFGSLMFQQIATDQPGDAFPVGAWVFNDPNGIRAFPYSFDMSIDPLTFDDYNDPNCAGLSEHFTGTIWNSALWDLNWLLIGKHGFESDLYAGYDAANPRGNTLTMQLVLDAMKLQPSNPSFTEARDAILLADLNLTGGANQFQIWQAFARRGLGLNADAVSSSTIGCNGDFITTDFSIPALFGGNAAIVVIDVSQSMGIAAQQDLNNDGFINDLDDINQDGVAGSLIDAAINAVLASSNVPGLVPNNLGFVVVARASAAFDMSTAAGFQVLVDTTLDSDGNGVFDWQEAVLTVREGRGGLYEDNFVDASRTSYTPIPSLVADLHAQDGRFTYVSALSDGAGSIATTPDPFAGFPAGVVINALAMGQYAMVGPTADFVELAIRTGGGIGMVGGAPIPVNDGGFSPTTPGLPPVIPPVSRFFQLQFLDSEFQTESGDAGPLDPLAPTDEVADEAVASAPIDTDRRDQGSDDVPEEADLVDDFFETVDI